MHHDHVNLGESPFEKPEMDELPTAGAIESVAWAVCALLVMGLACGFIWLVTG